MARWPLLRDPGYLDKDFWQGMGWNSTRVLVIKAGEATLQPRMGQLVSGAVSFTDAGLYRSEATLQVAGLEPNGAYLALLGRGPCRQPSGEDEPLATLRADSERPSHRRWDLGPPADGAYVRRLPRHHPATQARRSYRSPVARSPGGTSITRSTSFRRSVFCWATCTHTCSPCRSRCWLFWSRSAGGYIRRRRVGRRGAATAPRLGVCSLAPA